MTEQVRINFLNWQPDVEDEANEGLTTADNVIHDSEGYKTVYLATTTSFSPTGGLGAITNATVQSMIAKEVGTGGDQLCAWIAEATTGALHVGINGSTATTSSTGYPLSFATATSLGNITAFDVCEYGGYIFFTVEAQQTVAGGTETINHVGYMTY